MKANLYIYIKRVGMQLHEVLIQGFLNYGFLHFYSMVSNNSNVTLIFLPKNSIRCTLIWSVAFINFSNSPFCPSINFRLCLLIYDVHWNYFISREDSENSFCLSNRISSKYGHLKYMLIRLKITCYT